jgi:hypothetical protein
MSLIIDDKEIDEMATRLARLTGQSVEDVVREALRERLAKEANAPGFEDRRPLEQRVAPVLKRIRAARVADHRTDDQILGYNDRGIFD